MRYRKHSCNGAAAMTQKHLLIVEDDEDIAELMTHNLAREGFKITVAASGEDALKKVRSETYDCVLLDIMLPGIDGMDVCRALKKNAKTQNIPVVMVTAKGEESDIVSGLELGADDYLVKPFSPRVLAARIRTVIRRKAKEKVDENAVVAIHDLIIHPGRREVLLRNKPVDLTNMEFRVLHFLASQPGWVYSRYQIIEGVRGDNYPVTDRAIDVLIVGLRRKLGDAGDYIETVRGVGYRFKE